MKMFAALGAILALALAPTVARAQESNNDTGGASRAVTPAAADEFARQAMVSSLFEIEASRLALERTENPRIRAFAQQMIDDHTKAADEIRAAAGKTPLPAEIDPPHAALLVTLEKSGAAFDETYVNQQIDAHKQAVSLVTAYATTGPQGSLKGVAARLLPILQHHQEMAGSLKPTQ